MFILNIKPSAEPPQSSFSAVSLWRICPFLSGSGFTQRSGGSLSVVLILK